MWIDYQYYKDEYLLGREPLLQEDNFKFWATRAQQLINQRKIDIMYPPDYLKQCACEIAEMLYRHSLAPTAGSVITESNDGDKWTIKDADSKENQRSELIAVFEKRLSHTPYELIPYPFRGI